MSNKGLFITIEGCEGVGKSTQLAMLKAHFSDIALPAVFTREPGGTQLAEKIRSLILSADYKMDGLTELFLYQAARREHVQNVIKPALEAGKIVICDRFIDSTTAYQGYARGLDINLINTLNAVAIDGVIIDLTVLLDLDPAEGFKRKGGADKNDRMDSESMDFHQKVYNGFKQIAKLPRVLCVDASAEKEVIFKTILRSINERYRHKRAF